jgi:non-specific serine/threonine protein kinase
VPGQLAIGIDGRAARGSLWPRLSQYDYRAVGVSPPDRLDSWKEIAAYLSRSVRTVRRWEESEGLPVHRHMHQSLGSIYAYKSELDSWRRKRDAGGADSVRAAVPAATASILVLPFTNVSAEAENEYFADGLTDEVIADLSRIRALRVISRTSSMALKGTRKDVKTIGRELGVRYVVEGSVRRAGPKLRISARLIDAASDEHLWADKYDGALEDVFTIQERLARTIVEALQVRISAEEHQRLGRRPITNLHAYECYLRARYETFRWRRDAIDRAIQLLENGLAIVGENAELYAALGRAWLQYREAGIDLSARPIAEAERRSQQLSTLAPVSAPALQLRGWIHYSRGQIQDAVRDLKAAHQVEPHNPDTLALLANCYLLSGQPAAARPLIEQLVAVDPLTPLTRCMPGYASLIEGDFVAAIEPYRQMFEMDRGNPMARLFYVWVLALNDQRQEIASLVETTPPEVRDTIPARLTAFFAYAYAGDRAKAVAMLTPAIDAAANSNDMFPRFLAQGYALAGMPDPAIDWLAIAVDRGFINYPFLSQHDPFLKRLRHDGRFNLLLAEVRKRWEAFEA